MYQKSPRLTNSEPPAIWSVVRLPFNPATWTMAYDVPTHLVIHEDGNAEGHWCQPPLPSISTIIHSNQKSVSQNPNLIAKFKSSQCATVDCMNRPLIVSDLYLGQRVADDLLIDNSTW